jgi:hypothetical protein
MTISNVASDTKGEWVMSTPKKPEVIERVKKGHRLENKS